MSYTATMIGLGITNSHIFVSEVGFEPTP